MQLMIPALMLGAATLGAVTLPPRAEPGRSPVVHEVRMLSDGKSFSFVPASLTIKPGDQVKFVNVSGGPHNVAFDPAKVADPAEAKLMAAMKDQIAPLAGPLMAGENESYLVSFEGVPAGKYEYFCLPHVSLAMTGVITVE
jgi:plastocyanin